MIESHWTFLCPWTHLANLSAWTILKFKSGTSEHDLMYIIEGWKHSLCVSKAWSVPLPLHDQSMVLAWSRMLKSLHNECMSRTWSLRCPGMLKPNFRYSSTWIGHCSHRSLTSHFRSPKWFPIHFSADLSWSLLEMYFFVQQINYFLIDEYTVNMCERRSTSIQWSGM